MTDTTLMAAFQSVYLHVCMRCVCATVCFSAHAAFAHKSQKISPSLNKKRKKKSDYFLQWWVAKLRDDDCLYPEMTLFPAAAADIISYLPLLNKRRTELVQQHIMIQQKYSISRIMKWKLSCKCRRAASGCFLHSCERERGGERHRARDVQRFRCMDRRRALNSPNGPSAVRPNTTIGSPRAVLECSHTS